MFGLNKNHIKNFIKSFRNFQIFLRTDPYLNWIMIVVVFVILNASIISIKISEFINIGSDDAFMSEENSINEAKTIKRESLEDIIFEYELKKEGYVDLKRRNPSVSDPSV